jgi:hypothetical protein
MFPRFFLFSKEVPRMRVQAVRWEHGIKRSQNRVGTNANNLPNRSACTSSCPYSWPSTPPALRKGSWYAMQRWDDKEQIRRSTMRVKCTYKECWCERFRVVVAADSCDSEEIQPAEYEGESKRVRPRRRATESSTNKLMIRPDTYIAKRTAGKGRFLVVIKIICNL